MGIGCSHLQLSITKKSTHVLQGLRHSGEPALKEKRGERNNFKEVQLGERSNLREVQKTRNVERIQERNVDGK